MEFKLIIILLKFLFNQNNTTVISALKVKRAEKIYILIRKRVNTKELRRGRENEGRTEELVS